MQYERKYILSAYGNTNKTNVNRSAASTALYYLSKCGREIIDRVQ